MKSQKPAWRSAIGLTAIVLVTAGVVVEIAMLARTPTPKAAPARQAASPSFKPDPAPPTAPDSAPPEAAVPEAVHLRPLPVERRSATHEWTSGDGKDPRVIEKLAHNLEEFKRLARENELIRRRQLVYRNLTVPMLLDRARDSGQPLREFILPGLDGREVEVEVTEVHLMDGTNDGCVNGRVKGRLNSMVSVGFANGCESFNVMSPEEGLFLTADAREPGEVVVKEIDPNVYGRPPETSTPCVVDPRNPGSARPNGTPPSQ